MYHVGIPLPNSSRVLREVGLVDGASHPHVPTRQTRAAPLVAGQRAFVIEVHVASWVSMSSVRSSSSITIAVVITIPPTVSITLVGFRAGGRAIWGSSVALRDVPASGRRGGVRSFVPSGPPRVESLLRRSMTSLITASLIIGIQFRWIGRWRSPRRGIAASSVSVVPPSSAGASLVGHPSRRVGVIIAIVIASVASISVTLSGLAYVALSSIPSGIALGRTFPGIPFGIEVYALVGHGSGFPRFCGRIIPLLQNHSVTKSDGSAHDGSICTRDRLGGLLLGGSLMDVVPRRVFCADLHQDILNGFGAEGTLVHRLQMRSPCGCCHRHLVGGSRQVVLDPRRDGFVGVSCQWFIGSRTVFGLFFSTSTLACAITHATSG